GGNSTIPDAATKNTTAGAEAFAKYYFETVVNGAYSTGNISTLVKYSSPQCIVCRATVGDIATAWSRGKVQGGEVTTGAIKAESGGNATLTNVDLKYTTTRYVEVDGSGKQVFASPAKNDLDVLLQLTWSNDLKSWTVREIVNQALRGGTKG